MKRTFKILGILILVGAVVLVKYKVGRTPSPAVKAPTTRYHGYELNRRAINKAKRFTVLISSEGFGGIGRGTGILIDPKHVLTCAHMLRSETDDLWIYPYPGDRVVKGRPVAVSQHDDLAVLELSEEVRISHYAVFQDMHYDGQPITVIGNTKGAMRWFVTFGIVGGEWDRFLLTDAVLYGGNSGGPWINERGEVVALTDWTLLNNDGTHSEIHGGVTARTIHAFLERWKKPSVFQILLGMR